MEIKVTRESEMPAGLAEEIRQLQEEAFPAVGEFVRQRWWHTPLAADELWFTARREGRLVGSVRLVRRVVRCAGGSTGCKPVPPDATGCKPVLLTVAGIANVCSRPAARGTGTAAACMRAAQREIAEGGRFDFGMLFCGTKVAGYYRKLGWREIENDVSCIHVTTGLLTPPDPNSAGITMIFPGRRALSDWPEGNVDLNGHDW